MYPFIYFLKLNCNRWSLDQGYFCIKFNNYRLVLEKKAFFIILNYIQVFKVRPVSSTLFTILFYQSLILLDNTQKLKCSKNPDSFEVPSNFEAIIYLQQFLLQKVASPIQIVPTRNTDPFIITRLSTNVLYVISIENL